MTRPVASLPDRLRRQIIDHCLAELPNEACGLLAMDGGTVVKVYPTSNEDSSPRSYTIPPQEHYDALVDAESHGWEIGGVFHSHPSGPAAMSGTDIERALEPDWIYLVVGLNGSEPALCVWRDGVTNSKL
ncbi:MAG TPA: M67 family metallopeptidase [Acidimicrobiia bacterium]|nr:M67 family metallopeptidase [Acidimicrobiia bacterium]